jgi:hypothetical protein
MVSLSILAACTNNVMPPAPENGDTEEFGRGLEFTPRDTYLGIPQYRPALTFGAGQLPDRVDLSESGRFPTPGNQGKQQSCTGWASAYGLKTYQEAVEGNYTPTSTDQVFSPAFPYYFTNRAAGDAQQCVGAAVTTMKTVFDLLQTRGCATLASMPYDENVCAQGPTDEAMNEAKNYTIRSYRRLETRDEIRKVLSEGNPVVIGIIVATNYFNANTARWTVDQYLSDLNDANAGGHAFLIVGYDDNAQTFKVMNSWGTGWGTGGFWEMDYAVIDQAIALVNQGQTLLELWVAEDNVSDPAFRPDPTPVEDPQVPPATSEQITLSNVEFLLDATDDQGQVGLGVTWDLQLDPALQGDEITCALVLADAATSELLPDRDGQYAFSGFVAQWGSVYVSETLTFTELSMLLPYSQFDLNAGAYTLIPVLYAGNSNETQVTAVAGDGTFDVTVEQDQISTLIPVGDYYGMDNDGWFVDFFVEGDGLVFGGLTNPDPLSPFYFFTDEAGITQEGDVYMRFVLTGFNGATCEYLGGFVDEFGGEGIWACDDGANGTWSFTNFTAFYDYFADYDAYDPFDETADYFEEWDPTFYDDPYYDDPYYDDPYYDGEEEFFPEP